MIVTKPYSLGRVIGDTIHPAETKMNLLKRIGDMLLWPFAVLFATLNDWLDPDRSTDERDR